MEKITPETIELEPKESRWARYLIIYRRNRGILFLWILILVFVMLTALIHTTDVQSFDLRLSLAIQSTHGLFLDRIMEGFTYLGSIGTVLIVVAVAVVFFLKVKKGKTAGIIIVSLLSYPVNVIIKNFIERNRPYSSIVRVLSPNSGFSFPSGHAMISMTVYGIIAYLLWVYLKEGRQRIITLVTATLVIFFIGLSRIYLGAHWPTDVIGGWIAGLVSILLLAEIHKKITVPN